MPLTVQELIQKAKGAIAEGHLDEAEKFKNQASALKSIEALEPEPESEELKSLREFRNRVENEPAQKAGVLVVTEDEADKQPSPYKTFGDFLKDVYRQGTGNHVQDLRRFQSREAADEGGFSVEKALGSSFVGTLSSAQKAFKAAPTGLGESIPQSGGFLVGTQSDNSILSRTYQNGQVLQRVAIDPIGPGSNGMTYLAEAETSRATGSRRGGVRFYWVAENSALTSSAPTFRKMRLDLHKAGALIYVTSEQLEDSVNLESYVGRILPEELRFGVEDAVINGNGTGQPLGILNGGSTVSVAKETGQAAATITAVNISKMWARRWIGGTNYVWLYNQDIEPQLDQLNFGTGTGGQLVYMPPGGLSGAPYGSIKGRPAIAVEYAATLGTEGDLILADFSQYQMIDKGGIQSASSMHVRFIQDEMVYKFTYRVNGQPTWDQALTPYKGTNTVSPFVTLATRA